MTLSPELAFLTLLASSPLWTASLHAAAVRLCRALRLSAAPQALALLTVAAVYPLLGAAVWHRHLRALPRGPDLWGGAAYALIVYGCLGYSYFHLFNLSETARRLRILVELARSGPLTPAELALRYSPHDLLQVRLERLRRMRQVSVSSGRYRLRGRALWLAASVVAWWGRLLFPSRAREL